MLANDDLPYLQHFGQAISNCGIFLLEQDGRIARWNSGAERLYGCRTSNVLRHNFAVLSSDHDQQLETPATALALARQTGRAECVNQQRRKDGSTFWAAVRIDAIRDDADHLRHGSGSEVVLSISDNGIGLPADFEVVNVSTLGMQLLSLLADQPGAGMSIKPAHPTQFSLRFTVG